MLRREVMKLISWMFVVLGLLHGLAEAHAATYNFYFNNAEQGANSTANPSVTVQAGEPSKVASEPGALPAKEPEVEEPSEPPAVETVAATSSCQSFLLCMIGTAMPHGMSVERGLPGLRLGF